MNFFQREFRPTAVCTVNSFASVIRMRIAANGTYAYNVRVVASAAERTITHTHDANDAVCHVPGRTTIQKMAFHIEFMCAPLCPMTSTIAYSSCYYLLLFYHCVWLYGSWIAVVYSNPKTIIIFSSLLSSPPQWKIRWGVVTKLSPAAGKFPAKYSIYSNSFLFIRGGISCHRTRQHRRHLRKQRVRSATQYPPKNAI